MFGSWLRSFQFGVIRLTCFWAYGEAEHSGSDQSILRARERVGLESWEPVTPFQGRACSDALLPTRLLWCLDEECRPRAQLFGTHGPQSVVLFGLGGLGGVALLEELCHWGWALQVRTWGQLLVLSESSCHPNPVAVSSACCHALLPWWILSPLDPDTKNRLLFLERLSYSCFGRGILLQQQKSHSHNFLHL